MNVVDLIEREKCTGCGGCSNICSKNAIKMTPDDDGFMYPSIDMRLCTGCELCVKLCKSRNKYISLEKQTSYAAVIKNKDILQRSSSGGAFTAIAKYVIENGGSVFGCVLDQNLMPIHCEARSSEELEAMRGSKYVQSNTGDTFKHVKDRLKSGRFVLYTGTPCQIAALRAFLSQDYPNLITTDLVCHGICNASFFADYIKSLKERLHAEIIDYKFRVKPERGRFRGAEGIIRYKVKNRYKQKHIFWQTESYYYYYYMGLATYRESCYQCDFAQIHRTADFTIGDLWGSDKMEISVSTESGISLIIANSTKAREIFEHIKKDINYCEVELTNASKYNAQLLHPAVRPDMRDRIFKIWRKGGYKAVEREFMPIKKRGQQIVLKMRVLSAMPMWLKKVIKTMLKLYQYLKRDI